jgi:hypothetical protein
MFNIYRRYTKRSCRSGGHNTYLSRLNVNNDGIQPHNYHCIDGFQLIVEVSHHRFYRYGSESDDSGISICSSEYWNKIY